MEQVTEFYGIDISKDVFDVCTPEGKHLQFTNTVEGFRAYGKLLSANSRSVMEATGCYHQQLAGWLFTHGHGVSVVNPLIINGFPKCGCA